MMPKRSYQRSMMGLCVLLAMAMTLPAWGQAAGDAAHSAKDIAGDWQGTLVFPGRGGQPGGKFRLVLKIAKTADGGWSALNYSIDQGPTPMQTSAVTLKGDEFRFSIPALSGSYAGRVSADGNAIAGSWTQGAPLPLNFVRANAETAWAIPAPAPAVKPMTDPDPSYEVATIKPSAPGSADKYFRVYGGRFMTHDTSLIDLMEVAYGVHSTQIIKAPAWASEEKFDLVGVPDGTGEPNAAQWTRMLQKLLVDRLQLQFHHSQKELSVYVLAVGKNGTKNLTKSVSNNPLPSGLEFVPSTAGLTLPAGNATLGQFAHMLQTIVLDKPVVDKTGVSGTYDFQLTFKPNDSEFNGHPPQTASAIADDTAPELFEAVQQQLGLKLSVEKIPTDVMVIDSVQKPSAN